MPSPSPRRTLFYALLILTFLQLVSDFVESIYTFGLLSVDIPPEIASVVLFFTPLALLPFRRGLPRRAVALLAGLAAVLRGAEILLTGGGKMLAAGFGMGALLLLFPTLLSHLSRRTDEPAGAELGAGLALALSASILMRAAATGSDASLAYPWLGVLLSVLMLVLAALPRREQATAEPPAPRGATATPAGFGRIALLCVGFLGVLLVVYFALASPAVVARWADLDYRLVMLLTGTALAVYFAVFAAGKLTCLTRSWLLAWNALFVLSGTAGILLAQVSFPADPAAFPVDQPALALWQQLPLYLMLLLSPVVLADFTLLAADLHAACPSPRALATGFALASLFFLVVVLCQAFTTVYDYIPAVGPLLRDRFGLVFLMAGLGMSLPLLSARSAFPRPRPSLRPVFLPGVLALLLAAVIWAIAASIRPAYDGTGDHLRVLTYNLQQGYSGDGKRFYEGQLEALRALDADIIGLQETDTARFAGGNADLVRTLSQGLKMQSYYGPRTVTGTFGIALLSRYPIVDAHTFFMYSKGEQTAAIEAQIRAGGQMYTVLVTHLGNGGPIIQQQQVLQRLAGKFNIIAMGDFNFDQFSEQYRLTTRTLADAWVLAGSPVADGQEERLIDHLFVSPDVPVASAKYIISPASDHPGLVVEIGR